MGRCNLKLLQNKISNFFFLIIVILENLLKIQILSNLQDFLILIILVSVLQNLKLFSKILILILMNSILLGFMMINKSNPNNNSNFKNQILIKINSKAKIFFLKISIIIIMIS